MLSLSTGGDSRQIPPSHGANKQVNLRGIYVELMAAALSLVMVEQEVRWCAAMAGCRNTPLLLNRNVLQKAGSGSLFLLD